VSGSEPSHSRPPIDRFGTLRLAPILINFTDVGVRILAKSMSERTVGRGTFAFRAGEVSDGLSIIARGTLQLRARDGSTTIGELSVGDSLGGLSLLCGGEHMVSAWSAGEVELLVLSIPAFNRLRVEKPGAALKLLIALAADLGERLREAKGPLREFLAWQVSKQH
jgi:CRP-like cAMP-binding protein